MIPGRKCANGQPVPIDQEDFKKWAAEPGGRRRRGPEVWGSQDLQRGCGDGARRQVVGRVLACHDKYRNTPKEPEDRCMVTAAPAAK